MMSMVYAALRTSRASVPLAATAVALACMAFPPALAEAEDFRRLRAEQIRARVVGRDITDDFHWTEHYRRDGVLVLDDMGRRRTGRWRIERDTLCLAREPGSPFDCFQVWISGDEVSLRTHEADQTPPAFIRRHEGGGGRTAQQR
jgi:hypothetical protein